jgi:hypothetical protein
MNDQQFELLLHVLYRILQVLDEIRERLPEEVSDADSGDD